jgi:hypothetical protein
VILRLQDGLKYINNASVEYIDGELIDNNPPEGMHGNDVFLVTIKMRSGAEFRFREYRSNYAAMVKTVAGYEC